jgi:large subunit ribosomal protein L22
MPESTDVRATARFVPMSPQKVRLVLDLIRGLHVVEALDVLQFTSKAAAKPVSKLLRSAIASAEQNYGISRDELKVHEIFADKGPTRRWRRFGARGRFKPLLRRSSHITVVLREVQQAGQ